MGAKDSKPSCISYEDAVRRVSEAELSRLRDAFKRASNLSGLITKQTFIKEILGEYVPLRLAEHIFQACGGTHKGIGFKDLLCGLVLLTKGRREEKVKFIFSLYANEAGTHVHKDEMVRLVQACDGGYVSEAIADCFLEGDRVSYEDFCDWVIQHKDATSLTRWLLSEPCSVSLSNELETPTFYQTLAGVTHLEEKDIIELEKRYWHLKGQSSSGKFDLDTLTPLISPPIPFQLCEGIFNAFDENRDGHIDFKEMACGISACCKGPLIERQKFCFKVFDQDRDGFLSKFEVSQMIKALLFVSCETASLKPCDEKCISSYQAEDVVNTIFENRDNNQVLYQNDDPISLDEYLVWTVGQNLPLDFLNLLFQVCHIVFGLRPESKADEENIIRSWIDREEKHGLKVGQFWYLIAMEWWRSWNDYIDYQVDAVGPVLCGLPGSQKRSSKQQKRLEASVAYSQEDSGNVCLSSIVSLGEDAVLSASYTSSSSQISTESSEGTLHHAGSTSSLGSKSLLSPDVPRTPSHSPGVTRKITTVPPQRPASIDNFSLIVPNTLKAMILTGEGGKLRRHTLLLRGKDFEIVPEAVWRTLHQWYGGSPALPRQVILPLHCSVPELELHPYTLKLFRHHITTVRQPVTSWSGVVSSVASVYGGSTNAYANQLVAAPKRYLAYLATFSRMASLKHVFEFLCIRLRLRPEDTRLWLYKEENNLILLDDDYFTLEQLGFQDNEQILIEVRNKDLTWPEEMSNLLNSRLDQKQLGPAEKGATGLNNLGNTCFMNAALQCVSNTRPLSLYFISNRHLYELNRTNPLGMKGHIAKRYGDLVHELWSGTSRTIAPLKLRWTIGKYAPRFNGFQQHDSQELLAFLMDGLHEDLNRVHEKPYVELKDSDGRPDAEVAQEAWENHVLRNRSIIVDLFHGQLQSSVTCKVCGHVSVRFDPFNYLSLPLPMESYIHLEVTVVRLDGSVPIKYGLRLNQDDKYCILKQQLNLLCGLQPQQMVLAEVFGAHIKALPNDEHKIHSVIGGKLFVYELPLFPAIQFEDKERQTFTQIQRTTSVGKQNKGRSDEPNGVVFKIGDSVPDCSGQSCTYDSCIDCSSGGNIPPSSLNYQGQLMGGAPQWSPPSSLHHTHNLGHSNSSTSSLSSSLVSNASMGDLTDCGHKHFIIAYHRKMMRQDVYFLSSQKTRPTLFGLPLVLPCADNYTHQDLYQSVWTQVSRLVSPLPPSDTSMPNHAQDCDDSLGYEYPFTLKAVQKDGLLCAWCSWYRFCRGCKIDCCDADFNYSAAYIAIDWDPTALHLRYQASQEREILEHESVERTRLQQSSPIGLQDCLEAFTKEEHLGEEEKYYCSKCKEHQLASKKLQIWRLPPVLIVHLKRFQLLNGRWVKSHKIVRFPFKNFDPTEYLSPVPRSAALVAGTKTCTDDQEPIQMPSNNSSMCNTSPVSSVEEDSKPLVNGEVHSGKCTPEKDDVQRASVYLQDFHQHRLQDGCNPYSLKYRLYAIACHSGILGGGHYVSYACNPNFRWYCYNDSSCKEIQPEQIDADSAYMLFYEREGLYHDSYLPNVEGRIPDTKEIDEEFESDFRKVCCLQ